MNNRVLGGLALLLLLAILAGLSAVIWLGSRSHRPVGAVLTFEVDRGLIRAEESVDMRQVVAVVDRRLNPGRRSLARVRQTGPEQIEVATFTTNPAELRRIERRVQSLGTIEFRILANQRDHPALIDRARKEEGYMLRDVDGQLLARWVEVAAGGEEVLLESAPASELAYRSRDDGNRQRTEFLVVNDAFNVDGSYLVRADVWVDESGWKVLFALNRRGGRLFGALTGRNQPDKAQDFRRHLGIILDGKLVSAPAILATIYERAQITGDFSQQEVDDLVDVLNAGSLPAPLVKVGEWLPDPERGETGASEPDD